MLRNYFKTAFRNLWKNKINGSINLFGLTVGMTGAVFIFLWVQNEMNFNKDQPGKENIYRITNHIEVNPGEYWIWETSPQLFGEEAKREMPEVVNAARLSMNAFNAPVMHLNNQLYTEKTSAWVDSTWFRIFKYEFVAGNASAFAQNPFSIVLTESKAKKYFGNQPAVGKIIKLDTVNFTVQAIVKDIPVNSSFQFDIMYNLAGRLAGTTPGANSWNNFGYITFVQSRPGASKSLMETQLNDILNKNRTSHNTLVSLQPFESMYLEDVAGSSALPHGNKQTAFIFSMLGLLLLVTACINYVNLTTAKASLRAKEVSIRKITGAGKRHLFFQFIAESVLISLLALVITLLLIQLLLPLFNSITEKNFHLTLTDGSLWKVLAGTLLFASILNGIYPALLLSSFKPIQVFRGKSILQFRDGAIRKGLVVFQFTLSIVLIIGTIVIYKQLKFVQTTNPGYTISQVVTIKVPYRVYRQYKGEEKKSFFGVLKNEFKNNAGITAVSSAGDEIVNIGSASSGNADWDGRDSAFNPTLASLSTDVAYKDLFGLQMAQGRWFVPGTEDRKNYILNETAVKELKLNQPVIGQRFTFGTDTGRVVGVVKDFHYKSLHAKIGPMVISYNEESDAMFFLKTTPGNIAGTIRAAEKTWKNNISNEPFSYNFLDESFEKLYQSDIKTSQLILVFSTIIVLIAALGLVGLATFTAEQRTKEIGIRKVLGASVQQVATLLSKEFVKLVCIALLIASPIAWWLMNNWLEEFAYRIPINAWIFITAGLLAILVAVLSVSVQAIKAALANPVKSLRTE